MTPYARRSRTALLSVVCAVALFLVGTAGLAGCGSEPASRSGANRPATTTPSSHSSSDGSPSDGPSSGERDQVSGTVTVLAAASLTESFTKIGHRFEAAHPGVTVRLSFAGSSTLARQIEQGIPADVFASADTRIMHQVVADGDIAGKPAVFTRNRLEIAVPRGNPGDVHGLADLADPELRLALCAKQVPCGAAARKAFRAAHIQPRPDTSERDVKAVLTKVRSGEVDAGLVYRTDVRSARKDVTGIDFPEAARAVNSYPIARLREAPNARAARAFCTYVRSPHGRQILTSYGFDAP